MAISDTLPSKPLTRPERERIRARTGVKAVTTLGVTSLHDRRRDRTPATSLVVLVGTTVYALEYDGSGWTEEVLETDADRRDQLERALDRLEDTSWSANDTS